MAKADPDDSPNQTINRLLCDGTILIGYGKRGHGMNGKDADLDRVGQCLLTSLETVDPVHADNMGVLINLRLYVTISAPSYDGIDWDKVRSIPDTNPNLAAFFAEHHGIDLGTLDIDDESDEGMAKVESVIDHFREQAEGIVCGMDAAPGDPFAFMWNEESWDGGIDVQLEVPLSVDEYEAIEGLECHPDEVMAHGRRPALVRAVTDLLLATDKHAEARKKILELRDFDRVQKRGRRALESVASRISREIWRGNKGGTPERDRMKLWEEEVGLCNDMINKLECY